MKDRYYLRFSGDYEEYAGYNNKKDAIAAYKDVAEELGRYGQEIGATLHIAPSRMSLVDDPDFYLTLGPRGGVRCEKG